MNENTNLCEILKGHEGETFYSPLLGNIKFKSADGGLVFFNYGISVVDIPYNGLDNDGNMSVFPSKDQRDWNKWDKENNKKTPKTWSEIRTIKNCYVSTLGCMASMNEMADGTERRTTIEKSALALLKIHQLLEVGYGGNVKNRDRVNFYTIQWSYEYNMFVIRNFSPFLEDNGTPLCFHTKEQAVEFLSHFENVQLLRDYFMLN